MWVTHEIFVLASVSVDDAQSVMSFVFSLRVNDEREYVVVHDALEPRLPMCKRVVTTRAALCTTVGDGGTSS